MNGEDMFKKIMSGEDQSILGDIARSGLALLSKGYEKAVTMRNLMLIKALKRYQYL